MLSAKSGWDVNDVLPPAATRTKTGRYLEGLLLSVVSRLAGGRHEQQAAIEECVLLADARAVPFLEPLAKHPDERVMERAVEAILTLQEQTITPP